MNLVESYQNLDQAFDLTGMLPPLSPGVSLNLKSSLGTQSSSANVYLPLLVTRDDFSQKILPQLEKELNAELVTFIKQKVEKTFEIRNVLKRLQNDIIAIVGEGNFSALWLDREAFSTDSMEHRAYVTEAVIHVYSPLALKQIVTLLYKNKIPMIPYGEGGGYGMGVTPMAPAVTISVRGIDHISDIRPSRKDSTKFEISVGAGVPFKDLVNYLKKRGFILRCDPNTPRAATGGIAATGSNAGKKAWEVINAGRVITNDGIAAQFAADSFEQDEIEHEPFLMCKKFFGVESPIVLKKRMDAWRTADVSPSVTLASASQEVPLMGMKAQANHAAQQYWVKEKNLNVDDSKTPIEPLPLSAFVGVEGCTGFIYEITFEIEKELPFLRAGRWHYSSVEEAMQVVKEVKKLPSAEQPTFFELLSGTSIRRFLLQDFPNVFDEKDEIVLIAAVESTNTQECQRLFNQLSTTLEKNISSLRNKFEIAIQDRTKNLHDFETLIKPREALPKKLRTKCKTDMEIKVEYLPEVLKIFENSKPNHDKLVKHDVVFGHLTPRHTAIIHWNIAGFDLYDEEQSFVAWDYLKSVINKSMELSQDPQHPSIQFTGEHGVAGKAPLLWLNHIPADEYKKMCDIKDILDPHNLYNPDTLFLRTSISRSLRARLLNFSSLKLKDALKTEEFALKEAQRCTRCNACKMCPVIDAEHELRREAALKGKAVSPNSVLPSKRNIVMMLEYVIGARKTAAQSNHPQLANKVTQLTQQMLAEGSKLLEKCFYCRKCDKACPVDINIHPMTRAFRAIGHLPHNASFFWSFLLERMMGEDFFKPLTYRLIWFFTALGAPFLWFARKLPFLPRWIKTYTSPPTLSFFHYEPTKEANKKESIDNFVTISAAQSKTPNNIYIRYRGCMDTFGAPEASASVDRMFKTILGSSFVDLEKKMCCGFPFEADGLHERAKQSKIISMIEIVKAIHTLLSRNLNQGLQFTVFSNCPTCCEAIREMRDLLNDDQTRHIIFSRAKVDLPQNIATFMFDVKDTAEIIETLLEQENKTLTASKKQVSVGLKVPCHNTESATKAQLKLLSRVYTNVQGYDRCCGLSGTARLKHPQIGTKISEKLFEQVLDHKPQVVVSGCPSCRDGVKMQRNILIAEKVKEAEFKVAPLVSQIMEDIAH